MRVPLTIISFVAFVIGVVWLLFSHVVDLLWCDGPCHCVSPSCRTCILSPGGSPLGPAHEVFGWGLCGSASGGASWEGAGQGVVVTVSEGALLGRQQGAQREERERVCLWAEGESASEEGWMGQQRSPLVLEEENHKWSQ